ncbi:MAG: hypothetical protein ACOYO7_07025 [Phycisphaerales bacterium]|jgi:hypothetical protein
MPFRSGTVSYSRFGVSGSLPDDANDAAFALMAKHVVKQRSLSEEGSVSGWCTGRHVFDADFGWEHCGFSGALLCALRIDRAKVPSEIRRAYVAMAEDERRTKADDEAAGVLSRAARRDAKADAERRCKEEIADGRHRRVTMTPVLLDLVHSRVLAPISGDAAFKELHGLVEATFGARLARRAAGSVAAEILGARGMASDLEDAVPDAFTAPPAEAVARAGEAGARTSGRPEVPWALAAGDPHDFLGNVFLLWLWWQVESREGMVETPSVPVAIVIDKLLELDCPWGVGGKVSLRGDRPSRSLEAAKALQSGKWPRRMGLLLAAHGQEYECTLHGDRFSVSGLRLQPPGEGVTTPRLELEERLDRIATFDAVLVALYEHFLRERFGKEWPGRRQQIADWISSRMAARAAG